MLTNPAEYGKYTLSEKITAISRQVSPSSLPGVFDWYGQRALVDESGIIRTRMGNAK
jgi:hypothetical protein